MENVNLTGNVIAIKTKGDWVDGKWVNSGIRFKFVGKNLVTNDGDTWYARSGTTVAQTINFKSATAGCLLGTGTTGGGEKTDTSVKTACTGSGKSTYYGLNTTAYPRAGDTEANNSGATTDAVTWYFYWYASSGGVSEVNEGAIVDSCTNPTKALAHWDFGTTFDKTTSDTLQVFVNHTFSGV